MLKIQEVSKSYSASNGTLSILRQVNLNFVPGEAVAIMGPSGSGKSTFLHLLGTLDKPTTGEILFNDVNPFRLNEEQLAKFRNQHIGFIFQDHHLLPQCSVLENVLVPTMVNPEAGTDWASRAAALLEQVGLAARKDHRPAELSGGERQRAAVARALIRRPAVVLADEPTGNLDQANARTLGDLLTSLPREQNTTLIVVTHSEELASRFPRRLVVADGQLLERPQN